MKNITCRKCNRVLNKEDYDAKEAAYKCPTDGFYSYYGLKPPS